MPRGKNYVNNNRGVSLQANPKAKASMKLCEYGSGCTRPDCIYRHEGAAASKKDEVCLPFLADQCTFKDNGCRKRHPKKDEKERLIAKYKRTRCRHGDDCFTEGCLYLHPREIQSEPSFVEPSHLAFPPLNNATASSVPKPVANSAWKAAPVVPPSSVSQQYQYQHQLPVSSQRPSMPVAHQAQPNMGEGQSQGWNPMYAPPPSYYPPQQYYDPNFQNQPMAQQYNDSTNAPNTAMNVANFNVEAKEFVPGNSMT